jgi:hypothetical protein
LYPTVRSDHYLLQFFYVAIDQVNIQLMQNRTNINVSEFLINVLSSSRNLTEKSKTSNSNLWQNAWMNKGSPPLYWVQVLSIIHHNLCSWDTIRHQIVPYSSGSVASTEIVYVRRERRRRQKQGRCATGARQSSRAEGRRRQVYLPTSAATSAKSSQTLEALSPMTTVSIALRESSNCTKLQIPFLRKSHANETFFGNRAVSRVCIELFLCSDCVSVT